MRKKYEELTFADDFMFCKILQNNPQLCRELAEMIIGRKIGEIIRIDTQLPIEITADGRGVRFDVYMEDDSSTIYNIEMQTGSVADLPYRSRYYQGMIDLDLLERGAKFTELKCCYMIFICLRNPYKEIGLHKYSFRERCIECPELELGDGTRKIFLSAEGTADDVSEEMAAFLSYVAGHAPESDLTKRLQAVVDEARVHKRWRKEYMTLLERDEKMREEGRREGREEERANTIREAKRADEAEKEVSRLRAELERLKSERI